MSAEANKETIRQIYAAMEKGDLSVFGEYVDPDYVWHFPGTNSWARTFEGREAIQRDLIGPLFKLFQGTYTAKCINLVAEGDTVVAEVRGDVWTKAGGHYANEYCFLFRFRDGKIIRVTEYCDTDLEERILGNYYEVLATHRGAVTT